MTKQEAVKELKKRGQAVYEVVRAIQTGRYDDDLLNKKKNKRNKKNREALHQKFGIQRCRVISANFTRGYYETLARIAFPEKSTTKPSAASTFTF